MSKDKILALHKHIKAMVPASYHVQFDDGWRELADAFYGYVTGECVQIAEAQVNEPIDYFGSIGDESRAIAKKIRALKWK